MTQYANTNRRDQNEYTFVELWRKAGALWMPCLPGMGMDGILFYHGNIYAVEVKNSDRKWKLTKAEEQMRDELEQNGIEYHIITSLREAGALIGIRVMEGE